MTNIHEKNEQVEIETERLWLSGLSLSEAKAKAEEVVTQRHSHLSGT